MKRKKPGIFRVLSLLLALLVVVNLPISAFAADATQESDISALATDVPDEMLNSAILRALLYLGYDADNYLRNNNLLFTSKYIGNSLNSNRPSALTGIPYANGGGRSEKTATTAQEKADTKTGRVPNISAFQTNGMVCTSFIEYYYLNYLKNIEGETEKVQTILNAYVEALDLCNSDTNKYPDAWSTTGNLLSSSKYDNFARKTVLDLEYAMDSTSDEFAEFFDSLQIGALVQFGGDDPSYWLNDYIHYAVYAGCYNGEYYIIHVANSRGPEITLAKNMAKSNNKKSYPIAAYEFDAPKQFGSVDVFKADPDGNPLANAVFTLVNNDTGEEYTLITDSTGKAAQAGLYIDNEYTLTEVAAPPGYEIAEEHEWTFTLTAEKPTYSVSVTNTPKTGTIEIIKTDENGNLLSGAVFKAVDRFGTYYFIENPGQPGHYFLEDLVFGTYTVVEEAPPPGYELGSQTKWNVTLSDNSTNSKEIITVINTRSTGNLLIEKLTEDDEYYEGWEFAIYADADCSVLIADELYSDGSGMILYKDLLPGTYWVREEGHRDPAINELYYCDSENPQMVSIEANDTDYVMFENELRFGSIEIIKISIEGTPLSGAKFLLEWSEDGSMWEKVAYNTTDHITKGTCTSNGLTDGCLITDSTGIIAFTGLHPKLYYRITELEAPEGYLLLTDYVYTGQLPEDTLKLDFTVVNAKIFELPKTGAKSMTLMPVALLLSTATCVGVLLYLRKKKES